MLTCPMCKKVLPGLERRCRTCQTDVSLLVDYVQGLDDGLARAEALTRQGELAEAVWAYLQVLEVDPDNATARRQVGQVAAAVRQFDRSAPGRRWRRRLERQASFRRALASWERGEGLPGWLLVVLGAVLVCAALAVGYGFGYSQGARQGQADTAPAPATAP
jgi:hypothetical protein